MNVKDRNSHAPSEVVLDEIIGVSPAIARLRKALRRIAKGQEDVFIHGEPGVGKKLFAYTIYQHIRQPGSKITELDCAFFAAQIQQRQDRNFSFKPLLQRGLPGLLLLKRIENLPLKFQYLLLKSLQNTNGFHVTTWNCRRPRIIATCEVPPPEAIKSKKLDPKLYYHMSRVNLSIPPLRERKQDIPLLFNYFLHKFSKTLDAGSPPPELSNGIFEAILAYEWPGNVQELQNAARTLILTSENGQIIPEILPFYQARNPFQDLFGKPLPEATSIVESYLIKQALGRFNGNQTQAARFLQISEAALRYKLKKYKIK